MRRHLIAMALVIAMAAWLQCSLSEWVSLTLVMGLVFCTELMNTAVEWTVDLASPDHHLLAKRAKDTAAGAVLMAAIIAVLVGAMIFIPKLLALLPLS